MVKNKKFLVILVVSVLGTVLLTGCGADAGGETELKGKVGLTGSEAVEAKTTGTGNENGTKTQTNVSTQTEAQAEAQAEATATASGTLKAVDAAAGKVTIATKSGGELVLRVTGESKTLVSGALLPLAQLATKIGSEVNVEYHAETKTVTNVSIKG